ncbi:tetratricopeptide repeat protein [Phocaeicola sp.]
MNMYDNIEDIIELIEAHRLKEALVQINALASQSSDWQLRNEIEALQTSYDLMLQYTLKGMKDPNQKKMYNTMIRTAYELADRANIRYKSTRSFAMYYDLLRTHIQAPPHSFPELQMQLEAYTEDIATAPLLYADKNRQEQELTGIRDRHEKALNELFEKVWTAVNWNETEATEARTLLNSVLVSVNDLCVMVSAVTMSLLKIFDIRKYLFLLDAYRHTDPMVNQRAIVGIAIAALYHDWRIILYPEAQAQLSLLNDDPAFIENLHTIQIQLLLSRETQKIDKKMREEIIPEMMKNPGLKNPKIGFDDTEDPEDRNPEWENWIDQSGITDKLREIGELQMAGADVYMSTFAQLKQYPFFRRMSHWFYPFDRQDPAIASLTGSNSEQSFSMLNLLLNSDTFCNSDKYSFCFTLMQMPERQRMLMVGQLGEQNALSQEQKDQLQEMAKSRAPKEQISRQYIHDLYRFFKLWMRRSEEIDIFEDDCELWMCQDISKAMLHPEELKKLADYIFQNNYMGEAYDLFNKLLENNKSNPELWQKIGYTQQKMKNYDRALEFYKQADLLAPDTLWTNRHLALCYHKLNMPEQALEYYKKIEAAQPDNLTLSLQIGQCLVALKRYDEALAYFFKVEYLDKNPDNARRAIGWCSFVTGKYEEAKKYYDQLLQASRPKIQDWMNAGHVYQKLGNTERAVEYYSKAQDMCESRDKFIALYLEDKSYLLEQGFTEEDIYILLDELL